MNSRLLTNRFLGYALLGFTLFLTFLFLRSFMQDYSYQQMPEAAFLKNSVEMYEELCTYQDGNAFADVAYNKERILYWLALVVCMVLVVGFWHLLVRKKAELARCYRMQAFVQRKYESVRHRYENPEMQDKNLQIRQEQMLASLTSIRHSACAERFGKAATDGRVRLSKEDWTVLSELVAKEFPILMCRLEQIPHLTSTERKVALLMLLDMGTLEMSTVIGLQKSGISNAKKSLYEKLTGQKGGAKDLSKEIFNILRLSL